MAAAYYGAAHARSLLVLTSAMHGEEGYCGSGCQVALLDDQTLLDKAQAGGIGILLIHAVNAYGFSCRHLCLCRSCSSSPGPALRGQRLRARPPHWMPRSEERRVGKECFSTGRSRWSAYH